MTFKPMKGDDADLDRLVFPYMVTPKYDGHRCLIKGGVALTSALKSFPNQYIQGYFSNGNWDGLDGELIVGDPTSEDVFRTTSSGVRKASGEPDFTFFVFDNHQMEAERTAWERWEALVKRHNAGAFDGSRIELAPIHFVSDLAQLLELEAQYLQAGYEGLMLRSPKSPYKYGRATVKENYLLKLKRFVDFEAEIIGFVEQMENTNEKVTNNLGRSQRSSAKAGKVGKGTLGAFQLRAINGRYKGVEFECGTGRGLSDDLRLHIWKARDKYLGSLITLHSQDVGGYDKPRIPVFKGFRDRSEVD